MNATAGQDNWYLAREGKQHGPLSDLEMAKLVEFGHLRAADLVWRPGFADWMPAPTVFPESQPQVAPQPAAPPAGAAPYQGAGSAQTAGAGPSANAAAQSAQPGTGFPGGTAETAQPQMMGFPAPQTQQQPREPATARPMGGPQPGDMRGMSGTMRPEARMGSGPQPASSSEAQFSPTPLAPMAPAKPAKSGGSGLIAALGLLAVIGAGSTAAYFYGDTIKAALSGSSATPADSPSASQEAIPAEQTATPAPATQVAAIVPGPAPIDTAAIDSDLQRSPMWSLLKTEFPDWYSERVREVGQLKSEGKPSEQIDARLTDSLVALRRQNANTALAASPARLQDIAAAFIANLNALQAQSVDACYGFISKGEATPVASALMQKPVEGAPLHAQLQAVFAAVAEGRRAPVQRKTPEKSDYDLLATELGTIGWSQADIQLFADPKALSEAPRDQVCKMVRDWFSAHLAVKDEAARERLLFETLRPVVAG